MLETSSVTNNRQQTLHFSFKIKTCFRPLTQMISSS